MSILTRLFRAERPETRPPAARELFSDIAIERLITALMELRDPDEVLARAGLTRASLRALEYDDEIGTALETRLAAVTGTPWRLEPGEGAATEYVWAQLDQHVEELITGAWAALPYGYSVIEAVYERDGARVAWARLEEKPFEWFRPTRTGELRYFPDDGRGSVEGVAVNTDYKFFLTRRRPSYRNPRGEALLSRLYWPWFFRTNGWKFWARFLERFGSPLLLGKTAGDPQQMADALALAVQSAVAAVGQDDDVQAISPDKAGDAFDLFNDAVNRRIQRVVLGQTLTSDVTKGGSYAASKVHDLVRQDRTKADREMVGATIQRAIDALARLNFPGQKPPEFVWETDQGLETERAERDATLVKAGILELTEDYLLRVYDFEAGDFVIPESRGLGGLFTRPRPAGKPGSGKGQFADRPRGGRRRFTDAQEAVEELLAEAGDAAGLPIPPEAMRQAIREARDPEDLQERLAVLLAEADPEVFAAVLERAIFAADVLGYTAAEEGRA